VIAGVKETYRAVNTIRADFLQVRTDPVTRQKDQQRGKLALKRPRKMRFDFTQPTQQSFVTDGRTLWIYDAAKKQVIEQADLGSGSSMGVLLDDLGKLDELFTTTLVDDKSPKTTHTLHLVPKEAGLFQSLELTVSRQKYLLQDLVLVDTMGTQTELHFSSVKLDVDVPDSEFVFVAPPGVSVIKAGM
jgi:outer membrane lipoprotein carrier protein